MLRGLVAELVQKPATGVSALLSTLTSNMTTVQSYLGSYTPGAVAKMQNAISQAQNVVNKINAVASKANKVLNLLSGDVALSQQAIAFRKLESIRCTRELVTVTTPTHIYYNMCIEKLIVLNPEDTKYWTEFTINLVQIRTTQTTLATVGNETVSAQSASLANKGITNGTEVTNYDTVLDSIG